MCMTVIPNTLRRVGSSHVILGPTLCNSDGMDRGWGPGNAV